MSPPRGDVLITLLSHRWRGKSIGCWRQTCRGFIVDITLSWQIVICHILQSFYRISIPLGHCCSQRNLLNMNSNHLSQTWIPGYNTEFFAFLSSKDSIAPFTGECMLIYQCSTRTPPNYIFCNILYSFWVSFAN